MPRPRIQRQAPAPVEVLDEGPPTEEPPPQQQLSRQAREQNLAVLRSLPDSLTAEEKNICMSSPSGCFCCPAVVSLGQCLVGFLQAARPPKNRAKAPVSDDAAGALTHWGLNLSKFLFPGTGFEQEHSRLLRRSGLLPLLPRLLHATGDCPQGIRLTPAPAFVQAYGCGKGIPCSTSTQLAACLLLQLMTLNDGGVARAVARDGELLEAVVRSLEDSADDRYRCLVLQTVSQWLSGTSSPAAQAAPSLYSPASRPAEEPPLSRTEREALLQQLLDLGLPRVLVTCVLRRSSSAPALRDAVHVAMAMLCGTTGEPEHSHGPVVRPREEAEEAGGSWAKVDLVGAELAEGAALPGGVYGRSRDALLQAGLVPAVLSLLERSPSSLTYWLPLNMGVSGVRLLELQRWLLVVARACLLPVREATPAQGETTLGDATGSSSSNGASDSLSKAGGKGGSNGNNSGSSSGSSKGAVQPAQARQLLQLATALVQRCSALKFLSHAAAQKDAGGQGAGAAEGSSNGHAKEACPSAEEKAIDLLTLGVVSVSLGHVCPTGVTLDALPPADRTTLPDWRFAQRENVRRQAEEARARQAMAGANQAVDVLTQALGNL